jgi:dihydrofolate synthase/folylpolyglutamate synthase
MVRDMIEWLYGLQHFGIKLGLDNIRALLDILGHPERTYRSAHVAGTNGKGSVAAMIDSMLAASGVRSGLFTSPHLVRPHERVRIAGEEIGDEELQLRLAAMRDTVEQATADGRLATHPSFFEVITATALKTFADHGLQAASLEVGLGGRLDATNAVDADVAVIVSIDLDHTKTLGPTLERIAGEKAGIIKAGQPVICGATQPETRKVIERVCRERGATFRDGREEVGLSNAENGEFALHSAARDYPGLRCSLPGSHQLDNARIALAAFEPLMERLGLEPDAAAVRAGLASVRWAGRLEWIEPRNGRPRFLVDGAHNASGMAALVSYLRGLPPPLPVLLVGATSGKPLGDLFGPLAPLVEGVVVTRPPVERGLDPAEVARAIEPLFGPVEAVDDREEALERACALAGSERHVLVTGSLYLVGEILGLLRGERRHRPVAM